MLKKGDVIIIALLLTAAVVTAVFMYGDSAERVVVTLCGEVYGEYRLSENNTVIIKSEYGENTLVIEKGTAYFKNCDCPDKICENSKMSKKGDTAVCVPHKLVAEVVS